MPKISLGDLIHTTGADTMQDRLRLVVNHKSPRKVLETVAEMSD